MSRDEIVGMLRFHVDVNVDVTEMRDWDPERITLFFDGVAKVLTASRGVVFVDPGPQPSREKELVHA